MIRSKDRTEASVVPGGTSWTILVVVAYQRGPDRLEGLRQGSSAVSTVIPAGFSGSTT